MGTQGVILQGCSCHGYTHQAYVQASQDPPVVQGCALMVLHLFDREVSLEVARQRKLDAESGVVTEKYTGLRIK